MLDSGYNADVERENTPCQRDKNIANSLRIRIGGVQVGTFRRNFSDKGDKRVLLTRT